MTVRPDVNYIDGKRQEAPYADLATVGVREKDIPAALQNRHTWEDVFPYWDTSGILNARDYGVTGDGAETDYTDQSPALQRAIDDASAKNRPLFLPKGVYRIARCLRLSASSSATPAAGDAGRRRLARTPHHVLCSTVAGRPRLGDPQRILQETGERGRRRGRRRSAQGLQGQRRRCPASSRAKVRV